MSHLVTVIIAWLGSPTETHTTRHIMATTDTKLHTTSVRKSVTRPQHPFLTSYEGTPITSHEAILAASLLWLGCQS
jgi:hypothetical protein